MKMLIQIFWILLGQLMASGFSELNNEKPCPSDLDQFWPQKSNGFQRNNASMLSNSNFIIIPNNNAQKTGPIYKFDVVGPGLSLFEPGVGYRILLSTTEEVSLIHKFLISILSTDFNKPPGRLKSLSDKSEPVSVSCWKYLVKRSSQSPKKEEDSDYTMVPFEWEAPQEGCVEIRALIMDSGGSLFGPEKDPHRGLKKTLCVRRELPGENSRMDASLQAKGKSYCCRRGRHSLSCVLSGDSETFYKAHSKFGYSFESCSFAYTKCCSKYRKRGSRGELE